MEIKYHVFESEKLFVQKFTGIFSIENYIKYTRYTMPYIVTKSITKVLIDFRDLSFFDLTEGGPDDFGVVIDRMTEIRKNISNNELKDREVLLVFWVDKPVPTMIAHIFTDSFPNKNYFFCSTAENVMSILMLPEHLYPLEGLMNNLENTFTGS
jgi:hypothetical protein